jgi:hypothetical protein
MKMEIGIVIALITLSGVMFTAINQTLGIWLKSYMEMRHKRMAMPLDQKLAFNMEADRLCLQLRKQLGADRVFLANFHNGGQFKSGVGIDKFTIVSEDYSDSAEISLKRLYEGTLLSYAPFTFHKLLTEDRYFVCQTHCMLDKAFKKDLINRGVKSVYLFVIKDLNGEPLAFIEIAFNKQHDLDLENQNAVWQYHNKFLRVIKMKH